MAASTCLVIGASGLVGTALVAAMSGRVDLVGLSRHRAYEGNGYRWICKDLVEGLDAADLPERVDAVVYLAQSEQFRDFPASARNIFEVNTVQLLNALDYSRRAGVKHFVFASSGGVYGTGEDQFSEDFRVPATGELGFYLGTKLCSEILVRNYAPFFHTAILRFFFIYGARQRRNMLIPRLVDNVREGRPVDLQGTDGIRINPLHVSDAVGAIEAALSLDGSHTINVAGPDIVSLREIGLAIGRLVGRAPCWNEHPAAVAHHIVGDTGKMVRLLGAPKVGFEAGLAMSFS
ncbi:MAG: NAD(P)-dependent oxidoreductase [Burkholderiales bacterium]|nr:NAD(P)-dependent oxidoreductase [Burkholderiales bacterium]